MDLDAYVLAHHHEWRRLEELTGRGAGSSGAESDELVDHYQRVATHLSVVRTSAPDAALVAYLSSLLSRARNKRPAPGRRPGAASGFFTERFPAALYRLRWWWIGTFVANVVVVAVMMWWLLGHPDVEQSLLSPDEIDQLVNEDFEDYYSEYAASHFAAQVWINNAWVSALCIALGALGAPVVYLLFQNVANLAIIGSIMTRQGHGGALLGTDPPARAARADRRLRRGRGRPAALLVVGRARGR